MFKKIFRESNSLDADQAGQNIEHALDPNCLQSHQQTSQKINSYLGSAGQGLLLHLDIQKFSV